MKKVVYIHQYFKTPGEGGAIRSYHISRGMAEQGIQVDMITSHNKSIPEIKMVEGITIHYLPVKYSNSFSFFKRVVSFIRFVFAAISKCKNLDKPDLIYASSTPLSVGLIALWMKWTKKISYVFEVRDLWPEAPIQLKILKSSLLKSISKKIEKIIYKNAQLIIALSPGIKRGIENVHSSAKIHTVPNLADVDFFNQKPSKSHEQKSFIIGYFGAFGLANNLEFIIDIADECKKANLDVQFELAGEGAERESLTLMAKKKQLENVTVLEQKNRNEIREMMSSVDACITAFLNIPVLETSSPNKFFDGLAAGKLSIVNTKGWLKDLVEENKCGFFINPEKPEEFPSLLKPYLLDKKLLYNHQQNALQLAKEKFLKEDLVKKLCNLVLKQIS